MKKKISILFAFAITALLFAFLSGCTSKKDLSAYTIVYPQEYEEWQKEDVLFLAEVIEKKEGKKPEVVPDTEAPADKEIILYGANRSADVPEKLAEDDELSFIIYENGNKIVLGGNGFYSDYRAIYAFINDYIGFDDLTDTFAELPVKERGGFETVIYEEPNVTTMAYIRGRYPFKMPADVKDYADAGFNMVRIDSWDIDVANLREYGKWCARFGVRIIYDALLNLPDDDVTTADFDVTVKNPMMYGHYLAMLALDSDGTAIPDYHRYETLIPGINYEEKYGKYGWKLVVEIPDMYESYNDSEEDFKNMIKNNASTMLKDAYALCLNIELPMFVTEKEWWQGKKYLTAYEFVNGAKNDCGAEELWVTVFGSNIPMNDSYSDYPTFMHRNAAFAEAFGASGYTFANYKKGIVVNNDYTHGIMWENIKTMNDDMIKTGNILSAYDYIGSRVYNENKYYPVTQLDNPVVFDENEWFEYSNTFNSTGVIIGYYEKKDKSGIAICITPIEAVSEKLNFDMIIGTPSFLATEKNFRAYLFGEEITISQLPKYEGKYYIAQESSTCLLIEFDK